MAKKKDQLIRSSLENTPKVDRNINKRLVQEFAKYSEEHTDKDFELVIEGVEKDRRPVILRKFGAVAAAAVLVAGIGGGTILMNNAGGPDDPLSSDVNDNTPFVTDVSSEIAQHGVKAKEEIYFKMLNSIMLFDKVSGSYTLVSVDEKEGIVCTEDDFYVDLIEDKGYSEVTDYQTYSSYEDIINGNAVYTEKIAADWKGIIMDDCYTYGLYNNGINLDIIGIDTHKYMSTMLDPAQKITDPKRNWTAVSVADARDYLLHFDERTVDERVENDPFKDLLDGVGEKYLGEVLHPINKYTPDSKIGLNNFSDFDTWEMIGDTEYAGRDCVQIRCDDKKGSVSELIVDKATGCVLRNVMYKNGEFTGANIIREIHFDDDAEPVPDIDLSEYKDYYENTGESE